MDPEPIIDPPPTEPAPATLAVAWDAYEATAVAAAPALLEACVSNDAPTEPPPFAFWYPEDQEFSLPPLEAWDPDDCQEEEE